VTSRAGCGVAVAAAGALAVGLLAGCGSTGVTGSRPARQELSRALRPWSGFPVSASPRPLVLVGPDIADPPAGFPDGAAKLAYLERAVRFPARLPPGPAVADGFEVIGARQAVVAFRSGAATGPPTGSRLRVTTVRPGTGVFLTDRGPRRLPAWLFSFAGVRGPAAVLAVAPAQIFAPPIPAGGQPSFVDWALLGPRGRFLTVRFTGAPPGHGPCTADYSVQVASSVTAVAIAVAEHPHGSGNVACPAVGYRRQVTTVLPAPLGARVVVDALSRAAVAVTARNPPG
jgi:hypothetical protein